MHKLLLTGSNGFLGTHFYNLLHTYYNIVGIYNTTNNELIPESYKVNITNATALNDLIIKLQPQIIVHTAAISSIAQCEANEANAYAVNVTASIQLATLSKQLKAQFVFCSTDLVFDGTKGNYIESDAPNPINKYAEQKYIAEQKIIAANENAIIARLPLMIGENKNSFAGLIAEMQYKNECNETMYLFTNEYRTPALVEDIVKGINILLNKKTIGIYHIAGTQKMNRLSIAQYVKEKYNLENLQLIATTHQEKNITNRPADVSLSIDKIKALGFVPNLIL
jgi:dTDP-4-dehydrorhamnose reductase